MDSPGQKIRQARLRLGLTLEQISLKTRISVKNLQAIETDDPLQIGSAFLYRSFVRQFAEQLHLDFNDLVLAVQNTANTVPDPLMPGQQHASVSRLPPLRSARSRKVRWLNSTASFIFTLVACSTLYGMWQNSKSNFDASITGFMKSWTHLRPAAQPESKGNSTYPVSAVRVPPIASTNAAPKTHTAFRVELSALERTWLSIAADGNEVFSGMLEASETKVLEGYDTARVRTGNAGGVNIVFNGKALGPLGERGQVRTLVFTRKGYEVLDPPVHLALTDFSQNAE